MKYLFLATALCAAFGLHAQDEPKTDYGKVFGGFESNSAWYLNDEGRNLSHPEDPFRSNNYLQLNYQYKNWTAGIQAESYAPSALLNYNPGFDGTNLGLYFVTYNSNKLDVTVGHFYEQFGSGLIFRAWEDRALGINTALRGGRIVWRPIDALRLTAIAGRQRSGFGVSKGDIYGFDSDINVSKWLTFETSDLSFGFSWLGRYEKVEDFEPALFNELTNAYSGRFNFIHNAFYLSGEYDYKTRDAVPDAQLHINNNFARSGSATLVNFGYSGKGLGIDATLRRIENMLFLSEREPTPAPDGVSSSLNYNDKVIGFLPALTKQHHSNLANIYVYQAQSRVDYIDPTIMKAGETGGQIDVFYDFAKDTPLGGKYGTKIAANVSSWYNLAGNYRFIPVDYHTKFFGVGQKYYSDYNLEVRKQLSEKWHSAFYYVNQYYNRLWQGQGSEVVKTNILDAEVTYNFSPSRSIRVEGEHMWVDADKKNWAGATVEFNVNDHYSFYVWDIYNYGNDDENQQTHYYNLGGAYRKGSTRLALNYGRQRGGLVCVGGVCRFVPESTGLTISLSTAF